MQNVFLDAWDIVVNASDSGYFIAGNGPLGGFRMATPINFHIGVVKIDSLGNGSSCASSWGNQLLPDTLVASVLTANVSSAGIPFATSLPTFHPTLIIDSGCVPIGGGVTEENGENNIIIYPNPASDKINFSLGERAGKYQLTIFSALGQIVYTKSIDENEKEIIINEKFSAGIYTALASSNDFVFSKKLIIR
jgi:hypothetical protein